MGFCGHSVMNGCAYLNVPAKTHQSVFADVEKRLQSQNASQVHSAIIRDTGAIKGLMETDLDFGRSSADG